MKENVKPVNVKIGKSRGERRLKRYAAEQKTGLTFFAAYFLQTPQDSFLRNVLPVIT